MKYLILFVFLIGCSTTCKHDYNCEKKLNWHDPYFTMLRSVVTNGMSGGK